MISFKLHWKQFFGQNKKSCIPKQTAGFPAYQGNQGKLFYSFPVREKSWNLRKMPQIREKVREF